MLQIKRPIDFQENEVSGKSLSDKATSPEDINSVIIHPHVMPFRILLFFFVEKKKIMKNLHIAFFFYHTTTAAI